MEEIKYRGCTIKIHQDDSPESPREFGDNLGRMICFHKRHNLGDKKDYPNTQEGYDSFNEYIDKKEVVVALPLFLLDHGGLTMRTGTFHEDPGGWDTSRLGYIYCTKEDIRKNYGKCGKKEIAKANEVLQGEVETYSQWLEGDVWGFVAEDKDECDIHSCWGFYGTKTAIESAKESIDDFIKQEEKKVIVHYSYTTTVEDDIRVEQGTSEEDMLTVIRAKHSAEKNIIIEKLEPIKYPEKEQCEK